MGTANTPAFHISVKQALHDLQAGRMVLICDDTERENEADLCLPAQSVRADLIYFMLQQACGLLCVAMAGERLDQLQIPLAEQHYNPLQGTAFTVSVDARKQTTSGISAQDRATTIHALIDPATRPDDLARPGHVFPLRAHSRGTLGRRGHTEAAVDLMRCAGLEPAAAICEVLASDGRPARGEVLYQLARTWNIGIITVEAIVQYRLHQQEQENDTWGKQASVSGSDVKMTSEPEASLVQARLRGRSSL